MEIELIADYACVVGEGVIWHAAERCVYWVDIPAGRLFPAPATSTIRINFQPASAPVPAGLRASRWGSSREAARTGEPTLRPSPAPTLRPVRATPRTGW